MEHTDERTLAATALGEEPAPAAAGHLGRCRECGGELEQLRRAVASMRTPSPADRDLLAPPERVWTSITEALSVRGEPDAPPVGGDTSEASAV
ncbi:hypothetical protein ACFU9F_01560 [Streptomyces zhihengii]|uniref:Anti-sigma factor n=1 Tax=Streptomyces zhihengii TaxID=1818004 RepID=A0ABS2UJV3_9ACTN|nr:hypothetical protein [Streptomyces zhihengii]MBM9617618.1 hypothetical protein [Streptomyces zhihengii]